MGLTVANRDEAASPDESAAAGDCRPAQAQCRQPQEKIRSGSTKPRRPDRAVYVPRALRGADTSSSDEARTTEKVEAHRRSSHSADPKCPKSPGPKDRSAQGTPKRSVDKNFCNVYTPPHLRSQKSNATNTPEPPADKVPPDQVPNSDSAIAYSDNSFSDLDAGETFYIGDYFANGTLGFYSPAFYEYNDRRSDDSQYANECNLNMAEPDTQRIIDGDYSYSKDEDAEKKELKRASLEINRSSKRIIKQSFDSDVLVISDPVEEVESVETKDVKEERKPKQKLEARVSLKREENDWDAVFDDSGECLDPSLLEELTSTVGKVHISKTKNNYDQYQTRGQALLSGPYDETFAHVVEVYDFPSEFKTNDLLSLFSEYKDTGFEIKWVDDTHALIVFSSAKIAAEVLSTQRSLARCRPLHAATLESRNKAKKCAEFLQPYRQRPETCTALARRLVSGALGVRLSTARQERAEERRLITIAREKETSSGAPQRGRVGRLPRQPIGRRHVTRP